MLDSTVTEMRFKLTILLTVIMGVDFYAQGSFLRALHGLNDMVLQTLRQVLLWRRFLGYSWDRGAVTCPRKQSEGKGKPRGPKQPAPELSLGTASPEKEESALRNVCASTCVQARTCTCTCTSTCSKQRSSIPGARKSLACSLTWKAASGAGT